MELIASSTDDIASNIDGDADIAAFDTDLPAEHNVCACFHYFIASNSITIPFGFKFFSIWEIWNVFLVLNI